VDTNVVLRGLLNIRSASGQIVDAVDRRSVLILVSKPVLAEYQAVLSDPAVVDRFPELTVEKVEIALRRFRFVGEFLREVRARFEYPRDPRDEKLIELAIEGRATDIVSGDDDLLSLPTARGDAARRFRQRLPTVRVVRPAEFLRIHAATLSSE
jgi:putative PIN family toxin of toxin-antitoxin system